MSSGRDPLQRAVIELTRWVTRVPVKWLVAQATGTPGNDTALQAALRQAQINVTDGFATFQGPDTDLLGFEYRLSPPELPVHFNAKELMLLGDFWAIYLFNTPGFLAPGFLPSW